MVFSCVDYIKHPLHQLIKILTMIIKLYLDGLVKSGITLNDVETKSIEDYILSQSKPVKPEHLNHYMCLIVIRSLRG